ncbi:hypothetical protein J6590_011639 [Homalodisca vitripennis]|nr:hypothetical protein J6590_011639 [Homalodisca vitripennis]
MERRRIQWMGHVKRMGDNKMPRIALEKEERGRRPRGRPRGRWEDQVWKDTERRGLQKMQVEEEETWNDRQKWRKRRPGMTDKSGEGCVRRPVITETSDDDDDDDDDISTSMLLVTGYYYSDTLRTSNDNLIAGVVIFSLLNFETDNLTAGRDVDDELGALPRPIFLTPPVPSRLSPSIDRFPASSASALDIDEQSITTQPSTSSGRPQRSVVSINRGSANRYCDKDQSTNNAVSTQDPNYVNRIRSMVFEESSDSDLDYDNVDDSDADPDYVLPNDDNPDSSEEDCSEVSDDELERVGSDGIGLTDHQQDFLLKPTQSVVRLCKPIKRTNRNVTADNYFSSIETVDELNKRGLTYVGTMKKKQTDHSRGVPSRQHKTCGVNSYIMFLSYRNNPLINRFEFVRQLALSLIIPHLQSRLTVPTFPRGLKETIKKMLPNENEEAVMQDDLVPNDKLPKRKTCSTCPYEKKERLDTIASSASNRCASSVAERFALPVHQNASKEDSDPKKDYDDQTRNELIRCALIFVPGELMRLPLYLFIGVSDVETL